MPFPTVSVLIFGSMSDAKKFGKQVSLPTGSEFLKIIYNDVFGKKCCFLLEELEAVSL